jgi:hypothetical protein
MAENEKESVSDKGKIKTVLDSTLVKKTLVKLNQMSQKNKTI